MASDDNDIDSFLNHKTNEKTRGAYLGDWKEKGFIDTWMHTRRMPAAVWRHKVPMIVPIEDKDTKEVIPFLWSKNYVCHEEEEVLRRQYHRHDDGSRKLEPSACGLCKMMEWFYQAVQNDELSWVEPIFHFSGKLKDRRGSITDHEVTLHAAGIYNGYSKVDTDEEKRELKKAGIFLRDAWQEVMSAKCSYIFCVVDHNDLKAGVQIAVEPALLGEKVRVVIQDRIASLGKDEGNPAKNPYCIQWKFNASESDFGKKYHALIIERHKLTPAIRELIAESDPPDISNLRAPFDQGVMRAYLEKHCLVKGVPFAEFFPATEGTGKRSATSKVTTAAREAEKASAPKVEKKPEPEPKVLTTSTGISIPEDDAVACDACGKPMGVSWNKCVECGETYEGDGLEAPPEPPKAVAEPPKRTRTRAAAKKQESTEGDDPTNEIPFDV